jgi:hypothetical protein
MSQTVPTVWRCGMTRSNATSRARMKQIASATGQRGSLRADAPISIPDPLSASDAIPVRSAPGGSRMALSTPSTRLLSCCVRVPRETGQRLPAFAIRSAPPSVLARSGASYSSLTSPSAQKNAPTSTAMKSVTFSSSCPGRPCCRPGSRPPSERRARCSSSAGSSRVGGKGRRTPGCGDLDCRKPVDTTSTMTGRGVAGQELPPDWHAAGLGGAAGASHFASSRRSIPSSP